VAAGFKNTPDLIDQLARILGLEDRLVLKIDLQVAADAIPTAVVTLELQDDKLKPIVEALRGKDIRVIERRLLGAKDGMRRADGPR
jgi:hypothetical protein